MIRIAFQGEAGAFSEEAAIGLFGDDAQGAPARDFPAVVRAVLDGTADFAVLPVENTLVGSVSEPLDLIVQHGLAVVGEYVLPVRHCLLAPRGTQLSDVRRALSHPVALGQCRRFLETHDIEPVTHYDTAGAAKDVAAHAAPGTAAIASRRAAHHYHLDILASDIQDRADNQTRFLGVTTPAQASRAPAHLGARAQTKALIVLEVEHRAGALVRALQTLADARMNLMSIISRPADVPFHYRFVIEMEGDDIAAAVRALNDAEAGSSAALLGTFAPASG